MNASDAAMLLLAGGVLLMGGKKVVELADASANEKKYTPAIAAAEIKYGIPTNTLHRLIATECSWRTDIITGAKLSPVGAVGIAQFMPATAADLGINPRDPLQSIDGAGRYLASLYKSLGDWSKAAAAYNWGIGNVKKAIKSDGSNWLSIAPTETKKYVAAVVA